MNRDGLKRKENRSNSGSNGFVTTIISISLLLFAFYLIFNVVKAFEISQQKVAVLQNARKEVENLRIKNIQLVMERDSVETLDYVETEARDRLNYAKKGELVFVISDLAWQSAQTKVINILEGDKKVKTDPILTQWINFLF